MNVYIYTLQNHHKKVARLKYLSSPKEKEKNEYNVYKCTALHVASIFIEKAFLN